MNYWEEYLKILKRNEDRRMKESLHEIIAAYKANSERILQEIRELKARVINLEKNCDQDDSQCFHYHNIKMSCKGGKIKVISVSNDRC